MGLCDPYGSTLESSCSLLCKNCGNEFTAKQKHQVFCSKKCSQEYNRPVVQYKDEILTPGNQGALSELLASSDLISKGFDVYRALSPSSRFDLIIQKDGITKTVEVRTARLDKVGNMRYPKNGKNKSEPDYYAAVLLDEDKYRIFYEPEDLF